MKNMNPPSKAVLLSGLAAFLFTSLTGFQLSAQEKGTKDTKEQKTTTTVTVNPSSDKKNQKVTVVAKTDSKNKDGKVKLHIVKEIDGKTTVIDTTMDAFKELDGDHYKVIMGSPGIELEELDNEMKELDCEMKNLKNFRYQFDMPDMPEHPCCPEMKHSGSFNWCVPPPPQVFGMPSRGESLSDVLGDIPMSRVKSYKVIDKKGGKRIVIDLEDGPGLGTGGQVIYLNDGGSATRSHSSHKGNKDYKVIIKADGSDLEDVPPPPPPPDPGKAKSDSTKI